MRKPGLMGWAWIGATSLAALLGAVGYWIGGALGAAIGVAAGVLAPLLVALAAQRIEAGKQRAKAEQSAIAAAAPPRQCGPASLLDPEEGVVPFTGRQREFTALLDWCQSSARGLVHLVSGGGGIGKTRLALELCKELRKQGWRCVEVDVSQGIGVVKAEREAAPAARLLLVVDYAEAHTDLDGLLSEVARDRGWIRVLLLARQLGNWLKLLEGGQQPVRKMMADASRSHRSLDGVLELEMSADELVRQAMPKFAERLAMTAPEPGRVSVAGQVGARILDLHAAALVAVLTAHEQPADVEVRVDVGMVLEELLGHEKHYWRGRAEASGLLGEVGGLRVEIEQLWQVVAVGCLLGAATQAEAEALVARVPGMTASQQVARWLGELYPPEGDGHWLGWLRPDRLAELHATRELAASHKLADNCLTDLNERQARQALMLLARASAEHRAARELLEPALYRFPEVLGGIEAPREVMIAVANAIPYPSVALAEAHASIVSRIVVTYPAGTADPGNLADRVCDAAGRSRPTGGGAGRDRGSHKHPAHTGECPLQRASPRPSREPAPP